MRDSDGASSDVALASAVASISGTVLSALSTRHCCSVIPKRCSEERNRCITASRASRSDIGSEREKLRSLTTTCLRGV